MIIRAEKIDFNGAYYKNIEVSEKLYEAYHILKKMEADGKLYYVRINHDGVISLSTGYRTTNDYIANPLQKHLESMGLVVERNDCYNWFYVKEENDVDKYFMEK